MHDCRQTCIISWGSSANESEQMKRSISELALVLVTLYASVSKQQRSIEQLHIYIRHLQLTMMSSPTIQLKWILHLYSALTVSCWLSIYFAIIFNGTFTFLMNPNKSFEQTQSLSAGCPAKGMTMMATWKTTFCVSPRRWCVPKLKLIGSLVLAKIFGKGQMTLTFSDLFDHGDLDISKMAAWKSIRSHG